MTLDAKAASVRDMLAGIRLFARESDEWTLRLVHPAAIMHVPDQISGLIGHIRPEYLGLDNAAQPAVSVYSTAPLPESRCVYSDPKIGGPMIAKHFLERDLTHLCAIIPSDIYGARRKRVDLFKHAALEAGATFDRLEPKPVPASRLEAQTRQLTDWLIRQPKPMGLMTIDDVAGMKAIEACRLAGLRVPEDVAVVGHNNDQPICEFCEPSLSSVATHQHRIGYEAAALLNRLMTGGTPPDSPIRIPPLGIITRASSDIQHTSDPVVASALRFIRNHVTDGITPTDVIANVPASASTLQRRFRQHRGQTLGQALMEARIALVERLLLRDGRPLASIASDAGYTHLSQMCREFKQARGATPTQFRNRFVFSG